MKPHERGTDGHRELQIGTPSVLAHPRPAFNSGNRHQRIILFLFLFIFIILPSCTPSKPGEAPRRTWTFSASETQRIIVKSWRGAELRQVEAKPGSPITLTARPVLQATRPHGPEPDWRTKRAEDWPFDWDIHLENHTLTLTSRGETRFPHHRYVLEDIEIKAPPGVSVSGERQELSTTQKAPAR